MSKSDSKRQAILENAYRLFRAQGFDGTSMADITSEVGGSKATLYSHFPSKEELFVECMMAALENYMSDTLQAPRRLPERSGGRASQLWHERPQFHLLTRTGGGASLDDRGGGALRHREALL